MYSLEHKEYLKNRKKTSFFIRLSQFIIIFLFIIIWQLLAHFNLINTFIFSSPKRVLETIIYLHQTNNLYQHIFITVYETIISFLLGTIIGILIATLMWWNKFFAKVIDPYLTILNSLPKVALGPIIIIWAGAGMKSIIIMALLISTIITIINVYEGFSGTDPNKIKLMKSLGANKIQIYSKLILPYNYNNIISTLKINISMSLIGLLPPVGENFIA